MKIIMVDNYDREIFSDILICENINEYTGEKVCEFLNSNEQRSFDSWFKLVKDDYKLFEFEP